MPNVRVVEEIEKITVCPETSSEEIDRIGMNRNADTVPYYDPDPEHVFSQKKENKKSEFVGNIKHPTLHVLKELIL